MQPVRLHSGSNDLKWGKFQTIRAAEQMSDSSPEVNDFDGLAPNRDTLNVRGGASIIAAAASRNLGGRGTRKGI